MTFPYNDNQINALEISLSPERLARYIKEVGGDKIDALRRYGENTALSEAFYTPLHGLEISLRNSLNRQLAVKFGADWFGAAKVPVLQHPATKMLQEAHDRLRKQHKTITQGGIVAELNFGFWITILSNRYETDLWRPALRHSFPYRPRGTERKHIHVLLDHIRRLRNRIAHHEPILDHKLANDHNNILQVTFWICPDTADWIDAYSRVPTLLSSDP